MKPEKLRLSVVAYTNTLPFVWALENSALKQRIELQKDIPSICAQKLKFGQVDLALVPVALIPELSTCHLVSDYCIGADGIVDSVKLYSNVPIEEISEVWLDYQSLTSVNLIRVLFAFHWNHQVRFIDSKPGFENDISGQTAAVVIGDRTFALNGNFPHEWDLAAEWKNFTGLPFVFAAWVSNRQLPADFTTEFNRVLKSGVENIELAVESAVLPEFLSVAQAREYLKHRISYRFDDPKRKAMDKFVDYLDKLKTTRLEANPQ